MQKISFKSTYIFPKIISRKNLSLSQQNFVSTARHLTDKTKKTSCQYKKNGLTMKIIDKYNDALERLAFFYNLPFIKK